MFKLWSVVTHNILEPTPMIQCPFHGNFRVEYTDYGQDICEDSETEQSSVETCQDTKSLNFHFKHCSPSAALNNIGKQKNNLFLKGWICHFMIYNISFHLIIISNGT